MPVPTGILYMPASSTGHGNGNGSGDGNGMSSMVQMANPDPLCAAVGQVWMQVS